MNELYKIEDVIIMDFCDDYDTFMSDSKYTDEIKDRVKKYVELIGTPKGQKQVFLLSNETIPLQNSPKPEKNNPFRAYYSLADLFNKKIV